MASFSFLQRRRQRLLLQESNPHYLKTSQSSMPNQNLQTSEKSATAKSPESQPSSGRPAEMGHTQYIFYGYEMGLFPPCRLEAGQFRYVGTGDSEAAKRKE